jgi:hypothetical protein
MCDVYAPWFSVLCASTAPAFLNVSCVHPDDALCVALSQLTTLHSLIVNLA